MFQRVRISPVIELTAFITIGKQRFILVAGIGNIKPPFRTKAVERKSIYKIRGQCYQ